MDHWASNATFWYAAGLAIDYGICVGNIHGHRRDESAESKYSEYEKAHLHPSKVSKSAMFTNKINLQEVIDLDQKWAGDDN